MKAEERTPVPRDYYEEKIKEAKEISFKTGYFEGRGLGIRDGRREVVEWVNEYLLDGEYPPWQAKLKEWGLND